MTKPLLVLGLISGTSADGIDVALARISGKSPRLDARLLHHTTIPYPPAVREKILSIAAGAPTTAAEISQLHFLLGELFAEAALSALRSWKISSSKISLIGSHGQTVFHQGAPSTFLSHKIASTLQLAHPAVIAARTAIPTVADFRPADMASAGQGAPLVPFADVLLYRHPSRTRVALNIGGIANVTVIPPASPKKSSRSSNSRSASPNTILAFDTGPGNMLIDALTLHATRGAQSFDRDGALARRGDVLTSLLEELLADPYFSLPPPKSAGREQFGPAYIERILYFAATHRASPEDLLRTLTAFTALTVADALRRFALPRGPIHDVIVSGGGAHNSLLLHTLELSLATLCATDAVSPKLHRSSKFSPAVPEDAKEALAFALLAYESFHQRPANLPAATGATSPAILGTISYPYAPPR